jgi:microcystin degradation protein MlrC
MRVLIGGICTETNTAAPFPTGIAAFENYGIRRDHTSWAASPSPLRGPACVMRSLAEADGCDVIESVHCYAQPSGRVVRAAYERMRDMLLSDIERTPEIDIVLLQMHGAMAAEGYDDCEGDVAKRIRDRLPGAVIGMELDPHCHLTPAMLENCDLVILAKEYPHVDYDERAAELYRLCRQTALGEIQPEGIIFDPLMVGFYPTGDQPMRSIVDALMALESRAPILSASIAHGFPWADVAHLGTRVLVYADRDHAAAALAASKVAHRLYAEREQLLPRYPSIEQALDLCEKEPGCTVLGDCGDNPGGGAAGDSTHFLAAILERGCENAVVGVLWDPFVVDICASAGLGALIDVRLGGKCSPASGAPLDLQVEVMAVREDHEPACDLGAQKMGRSVWLRSAGVDIAVSSLRAQTYTPGAFVDLGISLENKLVVVKSSNHYKAAFQKVADRMLNVASPGTINIDLKAQRYRHIPENYYPRRDDPWAQGGAPQPQRVMRTRR